MNDALAVRRVQRVGHFGREVEQQLVLHRTPADAMLQRHPVEKLHHHEDAAVFFANVVNGADVGMIQRRSRARLAAESLQRSRIARHIVRQKLERDKAPQPRVLGLVDDTHAAAAELFDNAVVRDRGVNHVDGAGKMMPDDRARCGSSQLVCGRSAGLRPAVMWASGPRVPMAARTPPLQPARCRRYSAGAPGPALSLRKGLARFETWVCNIPRY